MKTALLQSSDQELEASFKELPNTWKALVDLFEAIKHKELSLKIKDYLHVPGSYSMLSASYLHVRGLFMCRWWHQAFGSDVYGGHHVCLAGAEVTGTEPPPKLAS